MATRRGIPKYDSPVLNPRGRFVPEWFKAFATVYDSSEQTITAGTTVTIPHGIGSPPRKMWCVLVCKTTDLGYGVGDEAQIPLYEDNQDYGVSLSADTTSIYATFGADGIRLMRRNAPIGALAALGATGNWRLVVRYEP